MAAETIIKQLGGLGKLKAMVAGHSFATNGSDLTFKFKGSRNSNCINIALDPDDTYSITFYKLKKFDAVTVKELTGIYCNQLIPLFEETTGLYLSL